MNTWYWSNQEPGIRHMLRAPPLWMIMNLKDGKCWCGKPKKLFEPFQRKYCCYDHSSWWFYHIRCYWEAFRQEILKRDDYICQECGFTPDKKYGRDEYFDVDHIVAISLGGMCFDPSNVRTICKKCHHKKTSQDMKHLKRVRRKIPPLENFF